MDNNSLKRLGITMGALLVAFSMVVGVVVYSTLTAVSTFASRINPACLISNMMIQPANLTGDIVVDGVQLLSGFTSGSNEERIQNAGIIYSVGKATVGVEDEDIVLALAASLGESTLLNLGHLGERNDHNSLGIFQMQFGLPNGNGVEHWGTPTQLMNPVYQANRFYEEFLRLAPYPGLSPVEIMQEVLVFARVHMQTRAGWFNMGRALFQLFESGNAESETVQEDKAIAVIGDSITVATNAYLFDDLAAAGFTTVRVDAQGARSVSIDTTDFRVPTTSQTRPTLTPTNEVLISGLSAIRRQRAQDFDPDYWLMLLGTNDIGFLSNNPAEAASQVRTIVGNIMDELGSTKEAMWLTVWSTSIPTKARIFNETLVELTNVYDNLIVGDWAQMVEENPLWLADHVHYTPEGNQQRSGFIGKATRLFGSIAGGIESGVSFGSRVFSGIPGVGGMNGCNFGSGLISKISGGLLSVGSDATDGTPIEQVSNPGLAQAMVSLEQTAGGHITYGRSSQRWFDEGRRGTFGHGNPEQWFADLARGSGYRSLDCSGLMNIAVYIAYGVRVGSCSYGYSSLVLDGITVTMPVMEKEIQISYLRPGDFIIKHNRGCPPGDDINHIVMVLGVTAENTIVTAESRAGADGFEVSEKPAEWYNSNWDNLIVSRWFGPGAIALEQEPVLLNAA